MRLTAYHEGGHTLAALLTKSAMPLHKVTILPRGFSGGATYSLPKDDELDTKESILAQIDVAMGGRAAEELIYGPNKITTGAGMDMSQASELARRFCLNYSMSDLGLTSYGNGAEPSPEKKAAVDAEVERILRASYNRVLNLLTTHREQLDRLATALLEHETLTADEVRDVVAGNPLASLRDRLGSLGATRSGRHSAGTTPAGGSVQPGEKAGARGAAEAGATPGSGGSSGSGGAGGSPAPPARKPGLGGVWASMWPASKRGSEGGEAAVAASVAGPTLAAPAPAATAPASASRPAAPAVPAVPAVPAASAAAAVAPVAAPRASSSSAGVAGAANAAGSATPTESRVAPMPDSHSHDHRQASARSPAAVAAAEATAAPQAAPAPGVAGKPVAAPVAASAQPLAAAAAAAAAAATAAPPAPSPPAAAPPRWA
jgi:hypothetical protein